VRHRYWAATGLASLTLGKPAGMRMR
jgi:hypothetical protein